MSDYKTVFPETEVAVKRFRALVDSCYFNAKTDDDRAVITNISGLVRVLQQDVFGWYSRELDHWARAARDAEDARDEELDKRLDAECTADGLAAELAEAQAHVLRLQAEVEGLQSQLRGGAA